MYGLSDKPSDFRNAANNTLSLKFNTGDCVFETFCHTIKPDLVSLVFRTQEDEGSSDPLWSCVVRCNVENWPYWKMTRPVIFERWKVTPPPNCRNITGVTFQQFGVTFQCWKVTFFPESLYKDPFTCWKFTLLMKFDPCWNLIPCKLSAKLNWTKGISNIELCMRAFVSLKRMNSIIVLLYFSLPYVYVLVLVSANVGERSDW